MIANGFTSISYPETKCNLNSTDKKNAESCAFPFPMRTHDLLKFMQEKGIALPKETKSNDNIESQNADVSSKSNQDILNTTLIESDDSITKEIEENDLLKKLNNNESTDNKKSTRPIVQNGIVRSNYKKVNKENVKSPAVHPVVPQRIPTNLNSQRELIRNYITPMKQGPILSNRNFETPKNNPIPNSIYKSHQNLINSGVKSERKIQYSAKKNDILLRDRNKNIPDQQRMKEKEERVVIVGRREYVMLNKLGEGGSCQVFRCLDKETMLERAIKIVNMNVDPVTANGYLNEVKVLKELQGNDRIIKMFDFEVIKNKLFVIMEKGDVDFSTILRNITKDPELQKCAISFYWIEMLKCVREIHKNGIIHSDLKPSNFLVVGGCLKLIDFGISTHLSPDMTSVIKNVQVGTFNYMSPEALLDSKESKLPTGEYKPNIKISYKSDVWSLGCILYQMIYKKTPFHKLVNPWGKIAAIIDKNYCIEYPEVEDIPQQLIEIIKKCLLYDMRLRPSVEDLLFMYKTDRCF